MNDTTTPVHLGTIEAHYLEGQLTRRQRPSVSSTAA